MGESWGRFLALLVEAALGGAVRDEPVGESSVCQHDGVPEGVKTYSIGAAAAILSVSTRTIVRWHASGRIRAYRSPGGHRRVPESEIRRVKAERDGKGGEARVRGS